MAELDLVEKHMRLIPLILKVDIMQRYTNVLWKKEARSESVTPVPISLVSKATVDICPPLNTGTFTRILFFVSSFSDFFFQSHPLSFVFVKRKHEF